MLKTWLVQPTSKATNRFNRFTAFREIMVHTQETGVQIQAWYKDSRACGLHLSREDAQTLAAALTAALEQEKW